MQKSASSVDSKRNTRRGASPWVEGSGVRPRDRPCLQEREKRQVSQGPRDRPLNTVEVQAWKEEVFF